MYKICFVCTGATCRSPMASTLFNKKLKNKNITNVKSSFCGLNVVYDSKVAYNAKMALKQYGINRVYGNPSQITAEHLAKNHLFVCLTEDHKIALQNMVNSKFKDKIVCFKDFCGYDILDPYGYNLSTYIKCLDSISIATDKLINVLVNNSIAKIKE